jgi:hypothetical protein
LEDRRQVGWAGEDTIKTRKQSPEERNANRTWYITRNQKNKKQIDARRIGGKEGASFSSELLVVVVVRWSVDHFHRSGPAGHEEQEMVGWSFR